MKAEELLLLPGNKVGSFLVRESTSERGNSERTNYIFNSFYCVYVFLAVNMKKFKALCFNRNKRGKAKI